MIKLRIKPEIVQIEPNGYHLLIPATISYKKVFFIIDTGASQSIFNIDAEVFDDIEKTIAEDDRKSSGINANLTGIYHGIIPKMNLADHCINNFETLFMTFEHINNIYEQYINYTIDGIIGGDFLHNYKAIIDYSKLEILLHIKQTDK
ncbi:MAG TPA: aspartyl protease family protein [Bacteroidales bacterium]|jgi:hypothetical protein|nr:aspartyl protease family protein [Bacteroidales bacterium]MDD4235927.1 aspartyl protease family protein [Bacteroidales bacterium]HXK81869.1 aspartyl protease family protein [Bacteroidales bacterium]